MRYASGLLVVIAAALVISAALPAAYGHLAEKVFKVPSISYEDMELTVRVSVTPHDFADEGIDEVNLKVKIFDLLTGNTLTQVTYRVEVWKNDDLLARSLFYDDDGIHYIEVRPDSNCDAAELYRCVTYDGSEHVGSPGALYAFGIECNDDNLDVCARPAITGPVFDKGGLYNVKIVIEGIGFPEVQLAERLTFDTFVSIVQEQDFLISTAHAREIPVVVKGHYDSVKNFAFDPSDSSFTFDMPFDWEPDHVNRIRVVHEEIRVPSSFAPYSDGTQFKGYVNGIEVSRLTLLNDPYSLQDTHVFHFLVGQSELERINADLGPEHHSNKNMNFRLVPVPAQPPLPPQIPTWVKNNAMLWAEGAIDDDVFIQAIQFLIQQGIIDIPPTESANGSGSGAIPTWVKNNAALWAEGAIDDDVFIQAIQFLIQQGIIMV